jgi:hypothetical protein
VIFLYAMLSICIMLARRLSDHSVQHSSSINFEACWEFYLHATCLHQEFQPAGKRGSTFDHILSRSRTELQDTCEKRRTIRSRGVIGEYFTTAFIDHPKLWWWPPSQALCHVKALAGLLTPSESHSS